MIGGDDSTKSELQTVQEYLNGVLQNENTHTESPMYCANILDIDSGNQSYERMAVTFLASYGNKRNKKWEPKKKNKNQGIVSVLLEMLKHKDV